MAAPPPSKKEEEEEDEQVLQGLIERLSLVDIESPEFLEKFPNSEEAVQLILYLRERLEDPEVRTIAALFEKLPANLRDQVDFEGLGFSSKTKEKSICRADSSSKKLERFKVRTLDLGGDEIKVEEEPAK